MLVVLNNVSEWERKRLLISVSFSIDSSLLLILPLTLAEWYRKLSLIKPNKVMGYNLLAGKNSKANMCRIAQPAL